MTAANTETLTAYLADHWVPSALGLVFGPHNADAGFTSIQVAGSRAQFDGAITMLKAARANTAGPVKASYTRCIKNLEGAL